MKTKKILIFIIILLTLISFFSFGENKTALVIGNGAYEHFPSLANPPSEARAMRTALESIGFEVVLLLDGAYDEMYDAIDLFERKLETRGGIGFFHYGGHGVQVDGQNYLIPVDKAIPDERRTKSRSVNMSEIVDSMEASGTDTNVIILDACRDNPLPAATRSTNSRGLVKIDAPVNSIIVYAAEAGETAQDGVFTPILVKYIKERGLEITDMMKRVRSEVRQATGGTQRPGEYSMLETDVYLAGTADYSEPVRKPGFSVEQSYGHIRISVAEAGTLYTDGIKQGLVEAGNTASVTNLTTGEHKIEMRYPTGRIEIKEVTVERDQTSDVTFTYNSIAVVPDDFALVEAGSFTMGSPESEPDRNIGETQHEVRITRDFIISKYEVTQAEYMRLMGVNPSDPDRGIGYNNPVNRVSWYDAVEYCNERSREEGLTPCYSGSGYEFKCDFSANGYRLPTEAEWEYAARGGNESLGYVYAGSNIFGSVGWHRENSGMKTQSVGRKEANELGIFDMSGNVWEWCWDYSEDYSAAAVTDPTGPADGSTRVKRGGDARGYISYGRAAMHSSMSPTIETGSQGFRVVRTAE